jgi:cardiolipin synthase
MVLASNRYSSASMRATVKKLAARWSGWRARRRADALVPAAPPVVTAHVVFCEGDELYAAMLADIAAAKETVRFETYIFVEDQIGRKFLDALMERARAGVAVRVRFDHAGSWFSVGSAAIRELEAAGIAFQWSRRWTWRRPFVFQKRNHRKLLIVDRESAFLGGFNIHAESSREAFGEGRWRDTHVRLSGPIVDDAIEAFDSYAQRRRPWIPRERPDAYLVPGRSRVCRLFLRKVLHDRAVAARTRIWATTPYFVPDRRTQKLLSGAAKRGIDVRLLVPAKSDVRLAQWATRAAYTPLLTDGVRIFEYLPRVLHAKTFVIDDDWASVGTANLDFRSFFLNDEINLIAHGAELNARLSDDFRRDLEESREVHIRPWSRRPWTNFVTEAIGWAGRRWL